MENLNNNILNNNIAEDTSNILIPDSSAIKSGIVFKSNINSNVLNGYLNLLSETIQYLQFTVGFYNKEANYNEGNIASLVIKNGNDYSIWQFRRNSNNPQVLNNNPPITGASITTINGIDIYEGGTLNTDWDKLTENYDVEATPNTVMIRDEEGASNVNMPSNVENTTVVNNEYLEEQLQAGLSTVQTALNTLNNKDTNLQNQINNLNIRYLIPPYHTQYPNPATGEFDPNEEPSNWYKKMYGVTTTWQIIFNDKSAFFRTEGTKSNVSRSNGLQPYGMKALTGNFTGGFSDGGPIGIFANSSGICYFPGETLSTTLNFMTGSTRLAYVTLGIDSTKQIKQYPNDIVVDNYQIRIYKLLTINGKTVSQIIQGV